MEHPIDTRVTIRALEEVGFSSAQAEALFAAFGHFYAGLATKDGLAALKAEMKAEMAELKVTLLIALFAATGIIIAAMGIMIASMRFL